MALTWGELASLTAASIATFSLVLNLLDRNKNRVIEVRKEIEEIERRTTQYYEKLESKFDQLIADVHVIKAQVAVFWRGVAFNSALSLHSPHTPNFDLLIELFVSGNMSEKNTEDFKTGLISIASDPSEPKFRCYIAQELLLILFIDEEYKIPLEPVGEESQHLSKLSNIWRAHMKRS